MRRKSVLLACVVAVVAAGAARADDVWMTAYATARTDPGPAGTDVVKLSKGTKVQQLQKKGDWVQIQVNGKTGWVRATSVRPRPVNPDTGLPGTESNAEMSSAAAAKGLEPLALEFAQNQRLDPAGVTKMEDLKKTVTQQMLMDFMAAGRLGAPAPKAAPSR
jgi:uncharacterized protein YgiM (DUF1202 family)